MSTILFFPHVTYVKALARRNSLTLAELCNRAGIKCRASGKWTEREVEIVRSDDTAVTAEPGDWGRVRIEMRLRDARQQARFALLVMAYGLHDLVAKQSVRGQEWARLKAPRGRPRQGRALTNKERQRRFRERKINQLNGGV